MDVTSYVNYRIEVPVTWLWITCSSFNSSKCGNVITNISTVKTELFSYNSFCFSQVDASTVKPPNSGHPK